MLEPVANTERVRPATGGEASICELQSLRSLGHCKCFACTHPELKLHFTLEGPNQLRSSIVFNREMTSFNGMVHGGILALVIDEAMTCALMAVGRFAATGELSIRYRKPVTPGITTFVHVEVGSLAGRLSNVSASLIQRNTICTTAQARFMRVALETATAMAN